MELTPRAVKTDARSEVSSKASKVTSRHFACQIMPNRRAAERGPRAASNGRAA